MTLRPHSLALAIALLVGTSLASAADTPIYTIQGTGAKSPLIGQVVTTNGVVTLLTNNGYFMQDLNGDGNPLTSDGIFVFTSSAPTVQLGQLVRVQGTVTEYNTGAASNTQTAARPLTQLTASKVLDSQNGFTIQPVDISFPLTSADELERYEGMLVRIQQPMMVQQNYFQARFGQLTLAQGGRLETPTNRYRPGAQAQSLADENARRRIILDDGRSTQNPSPTPYTGPTGSLRAGDTIEALVGVIDYGLATSNNTGLGDYKIHPAKAPQIRTTHPRPVAAPKVGGNVKVAAFNVLNYFTTFRDGSTADGKTGQGCSLGGSVNKSNCRGADNLAEFQRQRAKIVEALAAMDADAVGLMEIQNNGQVAIQNLVEALNTKTAAGRYAAVAAPGNGAGTDAIKVAMIYQPARLTTWGQAVSDTHPINNRPTLAQTFAATNGERFTLVVNHLKSKSSCPTAGDTDYAGNNDAGDGQGCWNLLRSQQVTQLRSFVAQMQNLSGSQDVLLVGDFNAYAQEDPMAQLTSSGYSDLMARNGFDYSYVFDGAAGRLDHAIATSSLAAKVSSSAHWHINADESLAQDYNLEFKAPETKCNGLCPADPYTVSPYRSSDHDPVLVGIDLFKTIRGTDGRDTLVGSAGDDRLIGGSGADTLSGGNGSNVFVYQSLRDAGDTITDFMPGKDRLDLSALLASIGVAPGTAVTRGHLRWIAVGNDTVVQIDTDGNQGPALPRPLLTLRGVAAAALQAERDFQF